MFGGASRLFSLFLLTRYSGGNAPAGRFGVFSGNFEFFFSSQRRLVRFVACVDSASYFGLAVCLVPWHHNLVCVAGSVRLLVGYFGFPNSFCRAAPRSGLFYGSENPLIRTTGQPRQIRKKASRNRALKTQSDRPNQKKEPPVNRRQRISEPNCQTETDNAITNANENYHDKRKIRKTAQPDSRAHLTN